MTKAELVETMAKDVNISKSASFKDLGKYVIENICRQAGGQENLGGQI